MSIHSIIASLKDQDQKRFFELRNAMRRAYLISMNKTIGIDKYTIDDDIQMDAIDTTVIKLMQRAGMGDEPKAPSGPVGAKELKQLEEIIIDPRKSVSSGPSDKAWPK